MKNLNFIILAAGKGTRMKNSLPKVLHKICDNPLISYVIETAESFQHSSIVAITSNENSEVDDYIKLHHKNTKIVHQTERLGTGHAVKIALPEIKNEGITIILYGDTPFISKNTIEKIINKLEKNSKNAVCVLGFEPTNPQGYGRLILDESKKLKGIIEEKEASDEQRKINLCNSGVMGFNNKYIKKLVANIDNKNSKKEYYLTDAIQIARNSNLNVEFELASEFEVMGINSQAERALAEKERQNYLRNKHLENGVILIAPETVFFSENTEIASGVTIHPYCIFKGKIEISDNCEIFAFSYIENAKIKSSVNIGPYARIRPQTTINEGAKIGNFVEVKKSNIGKNSKVNHLSYIGDTEMGDNVNIGAGTITCNYDGKNKYITKIEDNVFVGSNSSLIAPVTLGKNAIIGAGTTLFKDAKSGKITINEMPLKVL
jgi:bifunctional UDP-N-acetylglucosamine pyrophosphorylase/glucosamine-1-phosphate N-acetyltransferase